MSPPVGSDLVNKQPSSAWSADQAPSQTSRPARRLHAVESAALLAGDAIAYPVSFAALYLLSWQGMNNDLTWRVVVIVAVLCLIQFASAGLYPGHGLHDHERLRQRVRISIFTPAAGVGAVALLVPEPALLAESATVLAVAALVQPLLRQIILRQLRAWGVCGEKVVILGEPDTIRRVADILDGNLRYGLTPVTPAEARADPPTTAVLAGPVPPRAELEALLFKYTKVIVLADLPGLALSGLQPAGLGGRIGIVLKNGGMEARDRALRRLFDLTLALPLVMIALPLIGAAALAIRLVDSGPLFYQQERGGMHGRPLRVIKLRTMYRDADRRLHDLLATNPSMRTEWETHFKLRNDPRILPVIGAFLRSTSCDELPQLFNVIAGEMSLVGPRPFPEYHLDAMEPLFRLKRQTVMPGLTGLWQVSERSEADIERQQRLDSFYIDNRSIWLDGQILIKTVGSVLGRGGA